ncbi:response regulator [Robbsia andropogonis]|uniref:response regulator n=1 Tax=Robbsia andropogonis TaxID=28092 RepID=UPI0020A0DEFA|nr:response regulator [Robbsia andropogonis]MCP1117259.1 response regulator [Robbsia andropogonis]MCP1129347.1 response regulator [Robbsia andropogonis]
MRILLVEDDDLIGSGLSVALQNQGYAVDWARDGSHARLSLDTTGYELIVLDLGLPKLAGLELLKAVRAAGNHTPVLILTAKDTPIDRVHGLNAGADDYVGKPFDLDEVIARCRALIRRAYRRGAEVISWRNLRVDTAAVTVHVQGEQIDVTAREFAILVYLLSNAGIAQKKSRIEESIYGWRDEIESNAIEVHIHGLRKKIGMDAIRTIRGVGYLMEQQ